MSLADLMKKGSLRQLATVTVATTATVRPDNQPSVASVATVSVATAQKQAANDPAAVMPDPDRWCLPQSEAMNTGEIDTFTARLHHFTRRSLMETDAEKLVDKLVVRDRDLDDRRLCLECAHLAGPTARAWGCSNARRATLATTTQTVPLAAALVHQLQRCDGFTSLT